jgi:hypothetical protein
VKLFDKDGNVYSLPNNKTEFDRIRWCIRNNRSVQMTLTETGILHYGTAEMSKYEKNGYVDNFLELSATIISTKEVEPVAIATVAEIKKLAVEKQLRQRGPDGRFIKKTTDADLVVTQ